MDRTELRESLTGVLPLLNKINLQSRVTGINSFFKLIDDYFINAPCEDEILFSQREDLLEEIYLLYDQWVPLYKNWISTNSEFSKIETIIKNEQENIGNSLKLITKILNNHHPEDFSKQKELLKKFKDYITKETLIPINKNMDQINSDLDLLTPKIINSCQKVQEWLNS